LIELKLFGGRNEIVGIGRARATIMMSSTPFWLVNTGGSWKFAATAVPAPHPKAATKVAAHTHGRVEYWRFARWSDMTSLPCLRVMRSAAWQRATAAHEWDGRSPLPQR
jgi:hypothetical protein